jgi:hypothetical protein
MAPRIAPRAERIALLEAELSRLTAEFQLAMTTHRQKCGCTCIDCPAALNIWEAGYAKRAFLRGALNIKQVDSVAIKRQPSGSPRLLSGSLPGHRQPLPTEVLRKGLRVF